MSARIHYDTSVSCRLHLFPVTFLRLTKSISFRALFSFMLLLIILRLFTSLSSKYHSSILFLLFPNLFTPISFMQVLQIHLSTARTTEAASPEPVFVCCYFISKLSQNFFIRLLITRKVWNEKQIRSKLLPSDEYTQMTKTTATNKHFTQREGG
jgi:hypothetical protein